MSRVCIPDYEYQERIHGSDRKKRWIIPDCELPPAGEGELKGHDNAEAYYDNLYGDLFRKCPNLKGVTLVGESVEFPSRDTHTTMRVGEDN